LEVTSRRWILADVLWKPNSSSGSLFQVLDRTPVIS
jgi:hypothetical protein